jgi:hypothetical protein
MRSTAASPAIEQALTLFELARRPTVLHVEDVYVVCPARTQLERIRSAVDAQAGRLR